MLTTTVLLVLVVYIAAGLVKGVVGVGLPTVAIALLSTVIGIQEALAIVLLPGIATNVWQAMVGGALREIVRRLWPFLIAVVAGALLGSTLLARIDAQFAALGLGLILMVYSAISLATPQVPPPGRHEAWLSPSLGFVNGGITGLTGTYAVPGVLYLQALGMGRDRLIQAMGVLFLVSTLALAGGLLGNGLVSAELGWLSLLAVPPSFLGMWLGQRIRKQVPEKRFRTVFFAALALLGAYIAVTNGLELAMPAPVTSSVTSAAES